MWILSKLIAPAPLHQSIQRLRILEELKQANNYKLVLFQSPAGFGKTTMAAQWLSEFNNVGWFSIDNTDNDISAFAYYFISALHNATNQSCPKAIAMVQKNQFFNLNSLLNQAINEIFHWQEKSFLVLDDYHLIYEDEIHSALNYFIKQIPPNLTLVITSRTQPALGIANLRVRCQLLEIDNQRLAFDQKETHQFLSLFNSDKIHINTSNQFHEQVEGWPSALQLIGLNYKNSDNLSKLANRHTLSHLWDYLAEEVFDQLDLQSREFLMQCSIFSRFNQELISIITGQQDALAKLIKFNKQGLFINLIDSDSHWYRFHNLFAEFLAHQRQKLMPEQEKALRIKAIDAWLKINNPKQALSCALQSQCEEKKVEVLLKFGWFLYNNANLRLLNDALSDLHDDLIFSHPPLVLLQAWLAQAQHRYNEVGDLLNRAELEMKKRNIHLNSVEQGEFSTLKAQVAINQNNLEKALEYSEKAFENLANNTYHSRIIATSVVGEVHHCNGQLNRALPLLQHTEKLAKQHELLPQVLWAILQQAEIDIARGYTNSALEKLDKAKDLISQHHLEQLPLHEFMLRIKAQVMWNLHCIEEAEILANQSIEVMSYYDKTQSLPAFTQMANNALLKGELTKAQHHLDLCHRLLDQTDCHLDWRANIHMAQLVLWQLKEEKQLTQQWLVNTETPKTASNHFLQLQFRNIARAHFILGQFEQASSILEKILKTSQELSLIKDKQFNLTLFAIVLDKMGFEQQAESHLIEALTLSLTTRITACFYLESVAMLPVLKRLIKQKDLDQLVLHQAKTFIDSLSRHNTARAQHFDETMVNKILASDRLPDAIKTSPLTFREWQVMGLIYSGFSNEQISLELDVAHTTIKTHIRNLYQKLQISNREQAINLAERLIKSINY